MTEISDSPDQIEPVTVNDDGWDWAIVEIFGHRKHAGRTREEERFGAKMLRIDIPVNGDAAANGWQTLYYGGSAIFSFSPVDEETGLRWNRPYQPRSAIPYSPREAEDAEFRDAEEGSL